jgi:hypothetical protein
MSVHPPREWLRARLAGRLPADAAECFIDVLCDEGSYQRLAFNLGARWQVEQAVAVAAVQCPRLFADEDDIPPTASHR